jgi:ankyrin repeat protein
MPAFHSWLLNDFSLETVKLMLDHGADPTFASQHGQWTAIHHCAWDGKDERVLDLLLDHTVDGAKADINAVTSHGSTPVHLLLSRREVPLPLLESLLKRGADVNKDDSLSARPLQMACIWGEYEALKLLCRDKQVLMMDDEDNWGDTALHQAAMGSHADCIEFLVENGASIDAQNKRGRTALHTCAWSGEKHCVEVLLGHGADGNLADKHNRTPLFFACHGKSLETATLLLNTLVEKKLSIAEINQLTKRRRSVLRHAADRGFDQIVERIIKMAQEQDDLDSLAVNEADTKKGMTALHRAALSGHTRCVELLLADNLKVDVTARDRDGKTPLMRTYEQWALANDQENFEKIISMLISKAPQDAIADAELVANCAANGSEHLLKQLGDLGADLNRQDRYGWTPLELARKFQQTAAEQYLTRQAAWAGLLPSQWAKDGRVKVSEDGKGVEHDSGKRICISTDKPLPAGLDTFYFEVSIKLPGEEAKRSKPQPQYPILAIGFCTIGGSAIQFPGWAPREDVPSAKSWGYHGDDGGLFCSAVPYDAMRGGRFYGPPYQPGDTIGCGVNLTEGKMWFTRNGEQLENGFDNVQGRLFPLLGLRHKVVLETNFEGPFLWKNEEGKNTSSAPKQKADRKS